MKDFTKALKLTFELLLISMGKACIDYVDILVHQLFEVERGQLKHIPNFVIFLIYVLCLSVIFQAVLDIAVEGFMLLGFIEKIPLRINFIFLTILSTVMGVQTLKGLSQRKLDVTRNSILIGIIVETALIVGDLVLMITKSELIGVLPFIRLPFLLLTCMNLGILLYVAHKLKVFRDKKSSLKFF